MQKLQKSRQEKCLQHLQQNRIQTNTRKSNKLSAMMKSKKKSESIHYMIKRIMKKNKEKVEYDR